MNTVAEELDLMDRERGIAPEQPRRIDPFVPAVLPDTPPLPPPGIYFGMDENVYHALPALSQSGIKKLCASPMSFWAECTWLSQRARENEAKRQSRAEDRIFRTIGKAYHCRLLEGAEEYAKRFAVELSAEECDGALDGVDQIKAAIAQEGHKPHAKVDDVMPDGTPYKRSATKPDWIEQLLEINPSARILGVLQEKHRQEHQGKMFIPFDAHEQIEIAAAMIEGDENNRHAVTGGYAEVTLIWHCPETGVPMKARVDRLKLKAAVDLKTFDNKQGRALHHAIRWAIASYSYNLQPSVYVEGIQVVRELVRQEGRAAAYVDYENCQSDETTDWTLRWSQETEEPEWWWLFQQKGPAPVTRLVQYPLQGTTRSVTDHIIREAKLTFKSMSERYGTDPWIDSGKPYMIDDEAIPPQATENLRGE